MALAAPPTASRPEVIVEVGVAARPIVDTRAIERLVGLEIADVDVPRPDGAGPSPLYFRVRADSPAFLRVELWQLGHSYGRRSVSTAGTEQLRTRRIALAAAELARQLRKKREAELSALRKEAERARDEAKRHRFGSPIHARMSLGGEVRAAIVGPGDAWALGPAFESELELDTGQRVSLGAAWLVGETGEPSSSLRWLEVELSLAQGFSVSERLTATVGASAAAASVRLGSSEAHVSAGPLDTWSARAGLTSRLQLSLSRATTLGVGPDVGVILQPVEVRGGPGERAPRVLSGPWLGAAVSLTVTPSP